MNKKIIPMLLMLLLTTNKGVAMGEVPNYKTEIKEKYKQIDVSNGVSKGKAVIIAQNYMIEKKLDRDYIITKPKVEDLLMFNQWEITFRATYVESIKKANIFGLIGMFKWWISVSVDKKTGEVKSVGGPDL